MRGLAVAGLLGLLSCRASAPSSPATGSPPVGSSQVAAPLSVAITVDDLPVHGELAPGSTRARIADRLLDTFRRHGTPPVTGFVNGARLLEDPSSETVLRRWVVAGNPLGNHTYSHVSLLQVSLDAYLADLEKDEGILGQLMPATNPIPARAKFFRYPFLFEGDTLEKRNGVRRYLADHGYTIAEVSIDADDWAFNAPFVRCARRGDTATLAELRRLFVTAHVEELGRVRELTERLAGRDVAQVLLLHIGEAEADALDPLMTAFERAGARWIDLPTALADPFYAQDPMVVGRAGAAFPYLVAKARGISAPPPVFARDLEGRLNQLCR